MTTPFALAEAGRFDARKGFTRWILPGLVVIFHGHPRAVADIWINREGRLFTRFSSSIYTYHYEIVTPAQALISQDQEGALCKFLEDKLVLWVGEGIDDDESILYI